MFNTEAHPLPILGSAADAAARQQYVQLRVIVDAHAARKKQLNGTADDHSHEGGSARSAPSRGGIAAAAGVDGQAGDSTQQQSPTTRHAYDAAAAAYGCRLQRRPSATGLPWRQRNPLQAYIRMWQLRQTDELTGARQQALEQDVLLSNRQAAVNADIAVCEAELALLLRQEQAAQGAA